MNNAEKYFIRFENRIQIMLKMRFKQNLSYYLLSLFKLLYFQNLYKILWTQRIDNNIVIL